MLFVFTKNSDVSKWLLDMGIKFESPINIHSNNEHAFKLRCADGNLEGVQWLYHYANEIKSPINIHDNSEHCGQKMNAFSNSCAGGHLHVAKWLYEQAISINSPINIRINNDAAFRNACFRAAQDKSYDKLMDIDADYLGTVNWLCTLCDKYSFTEQNGTLIDFQISA